VKRKIPPEAFNFYFELGPSRSYEAVATRYQVSKRAISKVAAQEGWQERLQALDRRAKERAEEKMLETLEDMNLRQLKVLRFIQNKAIEALKSMPLDSAMDAVRAFTLSLDKERLIRGEPTDRNVVNVEEIIRGQHERWMVPAEVRENGHAERAAATSTAP
jgi:hypothetical protein